MLARLLGVATLILAFAGPGCSSAKEGVGCISSFVDLDGTLVTGGTSTLVLNTPEAKKTCHAKMRVEFRWADDARARDKAAPKPEVILAFNAAGGTYGPGPGPYAQDATDGVRWWWSEVDQGDKQNPNPTTFYQTSIMLVSGEEPVIARMGIYYTPADPPQE